MVLDPSRDAVPSPDGGWGWVVVVASCVLQLLSATPVSCSGILFTGFLLGEGCSSTTISWILNAPFMVSFLASFLVGPLVEELGWRALGLMGGLLIFLGMALSSLSPSPLFLFFSYSLLSGLCVELMFNLSCIVVHAYFSKRVGLAITLISSVSSVSYLLLPLLTSYLLGQFGFRGATLVLSGLLLHLLPAMLLMHPVQWHSRPAAAAADQEHPMMETSSASVPLEAASQSSTLRASLLRVLTSARHNIAHLKTPEIAIVSFVLAFNLTISFNIYLFIPYAMEADDYSVEEVSLCFTAAGLGNLVARMITSLLSQASGLSFKTTYIICSVVEVVPLVLFDWVASVWAKAVLLFFVGVGMGGECVLYSLVMVEQLGDHMLLVTFSLTNLFGGVSFPVSGLLVGGVRDLSGSDRVTLLMLFCLRLGTVALWTLFPAVLSRVRGSSCCLHPQSSSEAPEQNISRAKEGGDYTEVNVRIGHQEGWTVQSPQE